MNEVLQDRQQLQLSVELIGGADIDEADLDDMTRSLQMELEDAMLVEEANLESETSPAQGAKGISDVLGKLLLSLAPDGFSALVGFLKEWALRPGNRPVKIKVQGSGGSMELEYDPRTMTTAEIKKLASELQAMVN